MTLVPYINVKNLDDTIEIKALLAKTETQYIDKINWEKDFPSKPNVSFKMAHNGSHMFIHFFVEENEILAAIAEDNGEVWTDSCVEFFLSPDANDIYYNTEITCIGTALLGYKGEDKSLTQHASKDIMSSIKRESSLGNKTFGKKQGNFKWDMLVAIPASAYWMHNLKTFSGLEASGNFYKCGDKLTTPHFVTWNPIKNATPSFHLPQYFGKLKFEKL